MQKFQNKSLMLSVLFLKIFLVSSVIFLHDDQSTLEHKKLISYVLENDGSLDLMNSLHILFPWRGE